MSVLPAEIVDTFSALLAEAQASSDPEPTAMTVATADARGQPSARTVLLKGFDQHGFVFFTNFTSNKGRQLAANPRAALLFHWRMIRDGVQVKIEGSVEPVSAAEADEYFASRPRPSQIGAWASLQSQTLESRELFEARIAEVEQRFDGEHGGKLLQRTLLGKAVRAMLQSPLGAFVGALNGLLMTFAGALDALKTQREGA